MENYRTIHNQAHHSAMGDFQYDKKFIEITKQNYSSYVRAVNKLQSRVDSDLSDARGMLKQLTNRIEYMEEDQIIRRELFNEFSKFDDSVVRQSAKVHKINHRLEHDIKDHEKDLQFCQNLIDAYHMNT